MSEFREALRRTVAADLTPSPKPRAGELAGAPRESSKDASEADWHRLVIEENADLQAERDQLREQNKELVEALDAVLAMSAHGVPGSISYHDRHGAMTKARAILAKARP